MTASEKVDLAALPAIPFEALREEEPVPTAKRKPRRRPDEIQALHARLARLRPSPTIRQIDGVGPIEVLWPVLSNKTLWTILSTGLSHLIPRDPPLAVRWVAILERAVRLENSTVLTGGLPAERRQELHRALAAFAKLNFHRGVPKTGQDWEPVERQVSQIAHEIARLKQRAPDSATIDWWTGKLNRVVWGFYLLQKRPLTGLDIHNVRESKSDRAAAIYLVALSRHEDPRRLDDNLSKWRRKRRTTTEA